MVFLELRDVIKLYKPKSSRLQVPALRGVDLEVEKGEMVSIIGSSGSGKTTLIRLIASLDLPSAGTIIMSDVGIINLLEGQNLDRYRQEKVGLVSQFVNYNLIASLSSIENIQLPMIILGKLGRQQRIKRSLDLINLMELSNRRNAKPHHLSGGEAQRISIAAALANNPELLLADEPTGQLDSENTMRIIELFRGINSQFETTLIVVSHDESFQKLTDSTYMIKDGRISRITDSTLP